jgi:hypothetical protein
MVSHDVDLIHSDKNLQILHFHSIPKAINIMRQGLTQQYGKECASRGNWNVVVITAKGLGTVFVKTKIICLSSYFEQRLSTNRFF